MGRKKGYEREGLVVTATDIFRSNGYKGTSTEILVQELGVNRNSLYSEFGSKEGLFVAALEYYDQLVVTNVFGSLESTTATLDDIEAVFHLFAKTAGEATGLGCLMCNAAAELGGAEPKLQPIIESYFDRLYSAFCNALGGAVRAGQVACNTDISAEARFLHSCCLGISLMVRADIAPLATQKAIEGALKHVQLLRQLAADTGS